MKFSEASKPRFIDFVLFQEIINQEVFSSDDSSKKSEITDIFLTLKIGSERNLNLENNLFFINDKIPKFNPQFWKNHKIVETDN